MRCQQVPLTERAGARLRLDRHAAVDSEPWLLIRSSYADWWLNAKLTGELGAKLIGKNSEKEHRWRLGHVNRFLGGYRLDSANHRFDRVDPR